MNATGMTPSVGFRTLFMTVLCLASAPVSPLMMSVRSLSLATFPRRTDGLRQADSSEIDMHPKS